MVNIHQTTVNLPSLHPLHLHAIHLPKSLFVYVGIASPGSASKDFQPRLTSLQLAVPTKFDRYASVTSLLPQGLEDPYEEMAQRLATKLSFPVYLSVDMPDKEDRLTLAAAEKELFAFLKGIISPSA
ncbi:hypothetical protein HDU96_001939 [Phlyctochytrium bullatum]|nr:hypothetical protein HDU96_001939 [Phlyctochytrium bullatum]